MIFKKNKRLKNKWKNNRNSVERSSIGSGSLMNPNQHGFGFVVGSKSENIATSFKNLTFKNEYSKFSDDEARSNS